MRPANINIAAYRGGGRAAAAIRCGRSRLVAPYSDKNEIKPKNMRGCACAYGVFVALPCRMIKRRILHCGIGRASGSRLPQQTAHKIKRSYILRHSARRHFVLLERMPAKNADAASCSAAMTINAALRMPQNPSEPPLQRGRAGKTAKTKARQNQKRALAWDGRAGGLATVLGRLADAHSFRALVGRKGGIWRRLHATVRQTPQTLSSMTGPGTRMTHPNAPRRYAPTPFCF